MYVNDGGHDAPLDEQGRRLFRWVIAAVVVVGVVVVVLGSTGH
jgi:hypothetical protein